MTVQSPKKEESNSGQFLVLTAAAITIETRPQGIEPILPLGEVSMDGAEVMEVGKILALVEADGTVVIQGTPGKPPLDEGSVLSAATEKAEASGRSGAVSLYFIFLCLLLFLLIVTVFLLIFVLVRFGCIVVIVIVTSIVIIYFYLLLQFFRSNISFIILLVILSVLCTLRLSLGVVSAVTSNIFRSVSKSTTHNNNKKFRRKR